MAIILEQKKLSFGKWSMNENCKNKSKVLGLYFLPLSKCQHTVVPPARKGWTLKLWEVLQLMRLKFARCHIWPVLFYYSSCHKLLVGVGAWSVILERLRSFGVGRGGIQEEGCEEEIEYALSVFAGSRAHAHAVFSSWSPVKISVRTFG